jgi:hypothetical protein
MTELQEALAEIHRFEVSWRALQNFAAQDQPLWAAAVNPGSDQASCGLGRS